MKKFLVMALLALFIASSASATDMVKIQSYLNVPVRIIGMPDFPPFAYYVRNERGSLVFRSILRNPLIKALKNHDVEAGDAEITEEEAQNVKLLLVKAKSGDAEAFIGAYADTKLFSGLDIIYPAVIYNPIHVITLDETQSKIKSTEDLKKMRGIACREEYFSDFVLGEFRKYNISFVDTPYEAYEAVITGKVDYMFGSMYYNRIMASRFGVSDYLRYSKNPMWNIPFFVALSKMMPMLSEYKKVLKEEFENPDFAKEVKQEIIDIVNDEVDKNVGIVPPSFIQETDQTQEFDDEQEQEQDFDIDRHTSRGHIVEQEVHQKTIDEILDGL